MNENRLRKNQLEAIQISKENDFQSGYIIMPQELVNPGLLCIFLWNII